METSKNEILLFDSSSHVIKYLGGEYSYIWDETFHLNCYMLICLIPIYLTPWPAQKLQKNDPYVKKLSENEHFFLRKSISKQNKNHGARKHSTYYPNF